MTFIVFLRAVSDAGFYFFLAGVLACLFGADPGTVALGLALQCAALTAGYLLRERRARFAPLAAPALYIALAAGNLPERLSLLPFLIYTLHVLRTGEYEPTWDHEADLFSKFWKIALAVTLLWASFGGVSGGGTGLLTRAALPAALVTMTALILLTRALRHDRDVYTRSRRQLIDIAILVLLLTISAVLSSQPVLKGLGWAVKLLYAYLLRPVLLAVLWVLERIMWLVLWLLSFLMDDAPPEAPDLSAQDRAGAGQPLLPEQGEPWAGAAILRTLLILGAAALAVFLAYKLLRMLFLRGPQLADNGQSSIERAAIAEAGDPRPRARPRTPAGRVRREYRRFLRLCAQQGLRLRPRDTSLAMEARAAPRTAPEALRELRELYIAARYDGSPAPDAPQRAEEAYRQIKRAWHDGE